MKITIEKIDILNLIYQTIDEYNEDITNDRKLLKEPNAILYGNSGALDSLGLVNLIVNIEQNIQEKLNISITIADEKALSLNHSPFQSISKLAEYIISLIDSMSIDH